jgi:hypothetical protein
MAVMQSAYPLRHTALQHAALRNACTAACLADVQLLMLYTLLSLFYNQWQQPIAARVIKALCADTVPI